MQKANAEHEMTSPAMMRKHYQMLGLNLLVSFVIMYFVMFTMIWSFAEFFNNLNMFYMALMMATPMGALMLLTMPMMYRNFRLNAVLYSAFALTFALSFYAMRDQTLIGDRQFLRSMIPHHAGAVLMCRRASVQDPELRALCTNIIASQTQEIGQMKAILSAR
ncbi:MAG: DUF305 domain-containing protein [Croceibacterium sp.]